MTFLVIMMTIVINDDRNNNINMCRRLKNDPATRDIPVVMLSASGHQSDVEAGRFAGANDYLTKPFSPIALMQKIEAIVGR